MSNIQTAKAALKAELKHARDGLAFYEARVKSLEQAFASLDSLTGKVAEAPGPGRRQHPGKLNAAPTSASSVKPRRGRIAQSGLPSTGREFWVGLVTKEPQSSSEIFESAVKSLGVSLSKGDLKKLAQRQANALHLLVKSKDISDTGSGRARRYLRA